MAVSYTIEDVQRWLKEGTLAEHQAVDYLTALLVDEGGNAASARTQAQSWIDTWAGRGITEPPEMWAADPIIGQREEELGGYPTYARFLREAGMPQVGPFGAWARGQYGPAMEVYQAASKAAGVPPLAKGQVDIQPFTQFMENLGLTPQGGGLGYGLGRAATGAYGDIQAKALEGETAEGYGLIRPYAAPESFQEYGAGAGLGLQATRGRMGGLASQYLMPSETDLYQRFLGQERPAVSNWLPWLKQYLGF